MIVDQFEEVFTLCHDPAERAAFIDMLLTARQPDSRLRILLAVRADFYGRCAGHPGLAEALRDANLLVGPMSPVELREAIVKPTAAEGLTEERALTSRLVEEVANAPGGLPLLSHVLLETWRRRRGKTMTLAGYEAAGGMEGAVAKTAEDAYGRFTAAQAAAARRLLLRLVAPGDGALDTRRPADREELQATGAQETETENVLEALAQARLLILDGDTVELAHEALLTAWPRLSDWIEQERERLRAHRKLAEAAHAWEDLGRDTGALYRGTRLASAQEHFGSAQAADLTRLEHAFLTASITAHKQEEQAAARTTRRLRALTASLAVLLVLAVIAGLVAWQQSRLSNQQKHSADSARQVALSRQLAAQSSALIDTNSDLASLLAVQAYRTSATSQAIESLYAAAAVPLKHRLTGQRGAVSSVAFSPDGRTLATGSTSDDQLWLWDTRTGRLGRTFNGQSEATALVAFSPDGQTLTTAGNFGHGVDLWNVTTGHARMNPLAYPEAADWESQGAATEAFTADGRILAVGGEDGTLQLWDTRTGRLRRSLAGHAHGVRSVAFSPDGRTLASGDDDGSVRLWDMTLGASNSVLADPRMKADLMAFSPDAGTLATASISGLGAYLWDTRTGRLRVRLDVGAAPAVNSVAFSPDGRTLATATTAIGVQLWNAATGGLRRNLEDDTAAVTSVAFSADERMLATGSEDGTVRLWDPGTHRNLKTLPGNPSTVTTVTFSPDGRTLATGGVKDRTVQLWDTTSGHSRASLAGYSGEAGSVAFSPDSRVLAIGAIDGTVRLWDAATGSALATLTGHTNTVLALVFSSDSHTLLTAGADQTVRLWNIPLPPPATAIRRICRALGRDLTRRNAQRTYQTRHHTPHATCPT
ncbi:WD40 repeat [Streptomyces sp. OV198]|nr:WD40 repeat [Streptomyces sp. OV198]